MEIIQCSSHTMFLNEDYGLSYAFVLCVWIRCNVFRMRVCITYFFIRLGAGERWGGGGSFDNLLKDYWKILPNRDLHTCTIGYREVEALFGGGGGGVELSIQDTVTL